MNAFAEVLLWGAVQVTAVASAAALLYAAAFRGGPRVRAAVALAGLLVAAGLTVLAPSPWPRWGAGTGTSSLAAVSETSRRDAATPADSPAKPRAVGGEEGAEMSSVSLAAARAFVAAVLDPPADAAVPAAPRRPVRWGSIAAAAFVLLGVARFAAGWWSVRRLRRAAVPVTDVSLLERLDLLRAALGCRTPVELRETHELTTAAAVGGRRPAILLPAGWRAWTDAERSAVLAHELAHVRRGDAAANLFAQAALTLQFYHPLSHWLLGRLRLEQELAADAAAAAVTGGPETYLKSLATLALRTDARGLSWPARAFLPDRHTFLRRIEMLRSPTPLRERFPRLTRTLAVAAVLACGVLAAGFRPVPQPPDSPTVRPPTTTDTEPAAKPRAASPNEENLPDVLAYVPADAQFVATLNVAKLLADPQFAPVVLMLREEGGADERLRELFGFGIDAVESTALFVPRVEPNTLMTFVIRARAPLDWERMSDTGGRLILLKPDARTVVAVPMDDARANATPAAAAALPEWLAKVESGRTAADLPLLKEFAEADMAVYGDIAAVRPIIMEAMTRPERPELGMWIGMARPLVDGVDRVAAGLSLDSNPQRILAEATDPAAATRARDTIQALVTLATNAIDNYEELTGPDRSPEDAGPIGAMIGLARQVLTSAKVAADGTRVTAEYALDGGTGGMIVAFLLPAMKQAQEAAYRAQSENNLKQIGLALYNYQDAHGHFPPAVIVENGVERSWRVEILPYLDQPALWEAYRKDESWDSPANRKVLESMPLSYRHPSDTREGPFAAYFAVLGKSGDGRPASMWRTGGGEEGLKLRDVTDGLFSTILAVDAKRDIPWTKPEEITVDLSQPVDPEQFGGFETGGFQALFGDVSVRFISEQVDPGILRALFTRAGGERVDPDPTSRSTGLGPQPDAAGNRDVNEEPGG